MTPRVLPCLLHYFDLFRGVKIDDILRCAHVEKFIFMTHTQVPNMFPQRGLFVK